MGLNLYQIERKKIQAGITAEEMEFIEDNFQTEPNTSIFYIEEITLSEIISNRKNKVEKNTIPLKFAEELLQKIIKDGEGGIDVSIEN